MASTEVYTMPRVGKDLLTLGFSFRGLKQIPEEVFQQRGVQALWLGGNNLQDLPKELSTLDQLMYLDLASNDFSECPGAVYELRELVGLYLTGNQLRSLSPKVKNLNKIQSLWLDNNNFAQFPSEMCYGNFSDLEHVRLNRNRITHIPPTISELSCLKILELSNNNLQEVPASICELSNLQVLRLNFNVIEHLPRDLGCMRALRSLEVSNNKLDDLPSSVRDLNQLRVLILSDNNISVLPPQLTTQLENLETIDVENNPTIEPPYGICLQGVAAMRSYEAECKSGENVLEPHQKTVVLGNTGAGKTSLVKTLVHDRSFLTDAVEGRTHCIEVEEWSPGKGIAFELYDFGGHGVYDITSSFFLTPHSLNLIVVNVKTYEPDGFDESVGKWLRTLQSRVPGAVVCVVGTHTDLCDPEEIKSKVDDIRSRISHESEVNSEIISSQIEALQRAIHDYGKLPISHRLHGVSLQSLQNRQDQLESLRNKQLRVDSEVKLVSSAESLSGMSEFREHLIQLVKNKKMFPGLQRRLPPSWSKMEELVLQERKPFNYMITFDKALELGRSCNVKPEDVPLVISYLHQQGTVLYFPDNPQLRSYVFPDPALVIDIFKDIFHHDPEKLLSHAIPAMKANFTKVRFQKMQKNFVNEGLIPRELMEVLMRNHFKNAEEMEVIIALMQKLGLHYEVQKETNGPIREKSVYRLPWYLKAERPDISQTWPECVQTDCEQLTVGLEMHKFCPAGIFERLCAKTQPLLSRTYRRDWRDGVCTFTRDGDSPLLITRQSQGGYVNITAAGRAEFSKIMSVWNGITSVLNELKMILKEWPGVVYDEYIVCAHCVKLNEDPPELFPGDYLYQPRPEDLKSVRCPSGLGSLDPDLVYPPTNLDTESASSPDQEQIPSSGHDVKLTGATGNLVLVAGDHAEIKLSGLQLAPPPVSNK